MDARHKSRGENRRDQCTTLEKPNRLESAPKRASTQAYCINNFFDLQPNYLIIAGGKKAAAASFESETRKCFSLTCQVKKK